jgi:hypothetical protein
VTPVLAPRKGRAKFGRIAADVQRTHAHRAHSGKPASASDKDTPRRALRLALEGLGVARGYDEFLREVWRLPFVARNTRNDWTLVLGMRVLV